MGNSERFDIGSGYGSAPPEYGSPPGYPGHEPSPPAKPRRKRGLLALVALAVVGLAALGGGIAGVAWAYTRQPTSAQVSAAGDRLSAQQWRGLTAGQIFPASVSYAATNAKTKATLVGIVPEASCARAFDPAVARALDKAGCVKVLRATYADASDTALATIAVAVMATAGAADTADSGLRSGTTSGVLPVSFHGTVAGAFTREAREVVGQQEIGRYLVFYAAGYADGRTTTLGPVDETVTTDLSASLSNDVANVLAAPSNPCANREVRC